MSYRLVYYGNETLKKIAKEILNIDEETIDLVESMFNVMYRAQGIGLAAPQVDVSKRVIVVDIEEKNGPCLALINPVIKESSSETNPYEEGCLSLPGILKEVTRPSEILVKALTPDEREVEFEASGLLASVFKCNCSGRTSRFLFLRGLAFRGSTTLGHAESFRVTFNGGRGHKPLSPPFFNFPGKTTFIGVL